MVKPHLSGNTKGVEQREQPLETNKEGGLDLRGTENLSRIKRDLAFNIKRRKAREGMIRGESAKEWFLKRNLSLGVGRERKTCTIPWKGRESGGSDPQAQG